MPRYRIPVYFKIRVDLEPQATEKVDACELVDTWIDSLMSLNSADLLERLSRASPSNVSLVGFPELQWDLVDEAKD